MAAGESRNGSCTSGLSFSQASCLLPQAPMLNAVNPAQQGHKYNRDTSLDDVFSSFHGLPNRGNDQIVCGSLLLHTTFAFVMPTLCIIQPMCGLLMQQDMEDEQSESSRPPAAQVRLPICCRCCCGIAYNNTTGDINIKVMQRA